MNLRLFFRAAPPLLACAALAAACGSDPVEEQEDPNAPVATVEVSPSTTTIFEAKTVQLEAIARSASGKKLSGRAVEWTSHNLDIATIDEDGLVTGAIPGLARITATVEGKTSAPAEIDVKRASVESVEIEPGDETISLGRTIEFTAVAKDADGGRLAGREAFWTSSDPKVLSIDDQGVGRALTEGEATIEAEVDGIKGSLAITVVPGTPARVEIDPPTFDLLEAKTLTLTAKVFDAGGSEIKWTSIRWTSEDDSIATVASGIVTGEYFGTTRIVATAGEASGAAEATITEAEVTGVRMTTANPVVSIGEPTRLFANASSADGPLRRTLTWESSNPAIATVDAGGKVVAHSLGESTITASLGELSATAILRTQVRLSKVEAGGAHTCGITPTAGRVICFGSNDKHQLGTVITEDVGGTPVERTFTKVPVPADAPETLKFVEVGVGGKHTCAIATDGAAWCWGSNEFGQLGDGNTGGDSAAPVKVQMPASVKFEAIALGDDFSCALAQQDGALYCWGRDEDGRLGRTPTTANPAQVPGKLNTPEAFARVRAGAAHACAVTTAGEAMCWGKNDTHQAGSGSQAVRFPAVVAFGNGQQAVVAIAAGGGHSCGVLDNGDVFCWGANANGQTGADTDVTESVFPVQVGGPRIAFADVSAGGAFTCGLARDGSAHCWGANSLNQLGADTVSNSTNIPQAVRTGASFKTISSADQHTCGMSASSPVRAYCWGASSKGQLGRQNISDPGAAPVDGQ